jgi:hypothetical protein
MTNVQREQRGRRRTPLPSWARATARCPAVILGAAIAARLVILTIDVIAARNGGAPGGELTLPFYAAILPAIGWYLRGAWNSTQTTQKTNRRKEQPQWQRH